MSLLYDKDWLSRALDYANFFPDTLLFFSDPIMNYDAPPIYSTFFTSIWLWLFIGSAFCVRLFMLFPLLLSISNRWFDLDKYISERPLALMGGVLVALLTLGAIFGFVIAESPSA